MTLGICDCGKWGEAPSTFNEAKHFLKCPVCNKCMFLTKGMEPKEVGLNDKNKVVITEFIRHGG